jgi:glycosyltransferase involved in cell wall biosynthesis
MRVLYALERSPREIETFIRREMIEAMKQGVTVEAAYRDGGIYRVESAERILDLPGASTARAGAPLRPASTAPAAVRALLAGGARRASAHARAAGAALGSGYRQAVALAAEARRFGADLLHAHFAARACEDAMLASWIARLPFTFTAHGYDVHLEAPSDYPERSAAAAAVVTVSEDNARVLAGQRGVQRSKIRVVPLGVDTDRFRARGPGEEGRLVSVLRLHRDKGPDLLLDAAEELARRGVAFSLEIAGDGEERPAIEGRLHGALATKVRLLGRLDEKGVIEALARASIFVLPSRRESLGVALMEAMSCERPVVAAAVGGVPEVLDGGRCGMLVPPEDPLALASAIAGLLADPERRAALGAAGRERVRSRFRLDESVMALRAVWREAIGAARP